MQLKHIAIIMDGNGRWAKKRGLPRTLGHKAGMESLKKVVKACSELDIKILTVYAFSTENWTRPKDEVNYLMNLLVEYMRREVSELNKNWVRIKILGDLTPLPENVKDEINKAIDITKNNEGLQFNIAINYGGRDEIIKACININKDIQNNTLLVENINTSTFSNYLYSGDDKDPDLIIRTSGEKRLSNFLLWQSAYSELYFTEVLWPDFDRAELIKAIEEYNRRDRRYGNIL